jgi:hypothetical protein
LHQIYRERLVGHILLFGKGTLKTVEVVNHDYTALLVAIH